MNSNAKKWTASVWRKITEELFSDQTGLLYDRVDSVDHQKRFAFLPSEPEVAADFPNPCGWGTGMEDCALNGGFLLDILRLKGAADSAFAAEAVHGLLRCARVGGVPGFLVRGFLPGGACYSNSSRDQFTLAVYGMWRFHGADKVPETLMREIESGLIDIAQCCEDRVQRYHGELERLDGGHAVVSKMQDVLPHESLRLPMIYGAAFSVGGGSRFEALLRAEYPAALERARQFDPADDWWDMPLIQMQLSLDFFRQTRFPGIDRTDVEELMTRVARASRIRLEMYLQALRTFDGDWGAFLPNWRTLPMRLREETLSSDGRNAILDGHAYLLPQFPEFAARPNEILRALGNYLGVLALAPSQNGVSPAELDRLDALLSAIDPGRCNGVGIVPLLHGRLLWEEHNNGKIKPEKITNQKGDIYETVL